MSSRPDTVGLASGLAGVLGWLRRGAEIVSVVLFAALFLTFVAQVVWRYALRDPLVWTLEVASILFVVISLFTAATQMSLRNHVSLDLFVNLFSWPIRRILLSASLLSFAALMLASVPDTIGLLRWMYRERTYAIDFNLGHLFVLMIAFVIIYAIRALVTVVGLWRDGEGAFAEVYDDDLAPPAIPRDNEKA